MAVRGNERAAQDLSSSRERCEDAIDLASKPDEVVVGGQIVMGMREVMHVEHRIHPRALALEIFDVIDGLLGERQPETRHGGDALGDRVGFGLELFSRHRPC